MTKGKRSDVDYMEFRDGYVLVKRAELIAIFEGYKRGDLRRDQLRVFSAMCEQEGLHRRSKVDLAHIVNCRSDVKGIRKLAGNTIDRIHIHIKGMLESLSHADVEPRIAVSRRMLRHAARGGATTNEIVVMLYYCMRRIKQRRSLKRLAEGERYARFKYREVEALSGIPRANVCRAVGRLRTKGLLNTSWVKKQNENRYGLLFVDGALVSLTCPRQALSRRERPRHEPHKTTTPCHRNDNPLHSKSTTPINDNPKTDNQREQIRFSIEEGEMGANMQTEWLRIRQRANQMKAEWVDQAA